jgi:hypothetical protein
LTIISVEAAASVENGLLVDERSQTKKFKSGVSTGYEFIAISYDGTPNDKEETNDNLLEPTRSFQSHS